MKLWLKIRQYVLNKYVLTCLVFAVVLAFCGEHSLVERKKRSRQITELEEEIRVYDGKLKETRSQIEELKSGSGQLERYAREQYMMHADDEDVYIVKEED